MKCLALQPPYSPFKDKTTLDFYIFVCCDASTPPIYLMHVMSFGIIGLIRKTLACIHGDVNVDVGKAK